MEPFIEMFFAIDKDQTEEITNEELEDYVRENSLGKTMITRWHELFDPQNTGVITFAKFCEVLGLKPEETRAMRTNVQAAAPGLHPDITVISTNMEMLDQVKVTEAARSLATSMDPFSADEMSKELKQWLDQKMGPKWQVVIVQGSYWITFSHCPNTSIHFHMYDHTYLIWRTPDLHFIIA